MLLSSLCRVRVEFLQIRQCILEEAYSRGSLVDFQPQSGQLALLSKTLAIARKNFGSEEFAMTTAVQ